MNLNTINRSILSDDDRGLLDKALEIQGGVIDNWQVLFRMAGKAQSPELEDTILNTARDMYHKEEYYSGID